MSFYFAIRHREWRAIQLRLIVVEGDQQLRCSVGNYPQMFGVAIPHFKGQGYQRSSVVNRVNFSY